MIARLFDSLAKICKAPTVPSTISSILTPSAYAPGCWLPLLATEDLWNPITFRMLCKFWEMNSEYTSNIHNILHTIMSLLCYQSRVTIFNNYFPPMLIYHNMKIISACDFIILSLPWGWSFTSILSRLPHLTNTLWQNKICNFHRAHNFSFWC